MELQVFIKLQMVIKSAGLEMFKDIPEHVIECCSSEVPLKMLLLLVRSNCIVFCLFCPEMLQMQQFVRHLFVDGFCLDSILSATVLPHTLVLLLLQTFFSS